MDQLDGAVAFVTGGAQGIGLGIARTLADRGCLVAVADHDAAALDTAGSELGDRPVEFHRLDVRDRQAFAEVADAVETSLGPVTILCNNAGVAGGFSIDEMSYELWDLVLGVNLGGMVNGYQTFVPRMIRQGRLAHIVNTAAGSGLAVAGGVAGYMYQTSKYAVVGLSESTRLQLAQAGHPIGVTVLCPGPVATNIVATTMAALPDAHRSAIEADPGQLAMMRTFEQYLASGQSIDAVGAMVADAIVRNAQYVHTDRTMWDGIWQRTKALLDAMPAIEAPSTAALTSAEGRPTTAAGRPG